MKRPAKSAKSVKSPNRGKLDQRRVTMAELHQHAEQQLRKRLKKSSAAHEAASVTDARRLFHELQVHQVELEMQNVELEESRDRLETLVEKYTDLYDFAPVGYLSLDEQGRIMEANLTGAALLGVARARLINCRLPAFLAEASRPVFLAFLAKIFAGTGKQVCEAMLLKANTAPFWANFHGVSALSLSDPQKRCRVVVSDITALKDVEEAHRRVEVLAEANRQLKREIVQRQAVEDSLKQNERHQNQMLEQSRSTQEQLRQLSRQVLSAQEDERKEISRELHDVIAQTLTGINVRLAALKKEGVVNVKGLDHNIALTQKLVEKSVDIVHRFARELRPAVLDDLGLIPALHSFLKNFTARTGIHTHLTAFAGVEDLDTVRRTVLYRVAQEALTNVSRHAQASRVHVTLKKLPGGVGMDISDDGKSFSVEQTLRANKGKRLGLLGMRERMEMVGGQFAVKSAPGQGTTVMAQIPAGKSRPRRMG